MCHTSGAASVSVSVYASVCACACVCVCVEVLRSLYRAKKAYIGQKKPI